MPQNCLNLSRFLGRKLVIRSITACLLSLTVTAIHPQEVMSVTSRDDITGSVMNARGEIIREATITFRNESSGAIIQVKPDTKGSFSLPVILPGIYTVTAEATGYALWKQGGLSVGDNDRIFTKIILESDSDSQERAKRFLENTANESTLAAGGNWWRVLKPSSASIRDPKPKSNLSRLSLTEFLSPKITKEVLFIPK